MYSIAPLCFLVLAFPIFENTLKYVVIGFLIFCFLALPIYILAMFQKCPACENRILILPNGLRRPEFIKSNTFWYSNFGELLQIIKSGKLPCHHCGKVNQLK
jgi:hypothetical protein